MIVVSFMTEKLELYKCHNCGNLVQVLVNGIGELVCCGQNMENLVPKYEENNELAEKHVPIIEEENNRRIVTLKHHPMVEEHYIQFIEVISDDNKYVKRKYLTPEDKEAVLSFKCECKEGIKARELCNIHGLWAN